MQKLRCITYLNHLREFFYWLECQERIDINHITAQDITNYYKEIVNVVLITG